MTLLHLFPLTLIAFAAWLMVGPRRRPVTYAQWGLAVDCAGVPFDYAAFNRAWEDAFDDDAPNVVEDDELADAWITDEHCAELDEMFGEPILPGTPVIVQALAQL